MSGLHGAAKYMHPRKLTLLTALGVATASRGADSTKHCWHAEFTSAETPNCHDWCALEHQAGSLCVNPTICGRDDEACCCTSETCSGIIDAGITSSTACATEPPAGDSSLAVTIIIIVAIAVSLLCPLGLLIWYLRLPAERRAAMWNDRLEAIGAAPKATAAA